MTPTEPLVMGGYTPPPAPDVAAVTHTPVAAPAPRVTMLQALRQDVASRGRRDDIYLSVPTLTAKGYCVRFDPNIKFGDLEEWRRWATTRAPSGTEIMDSLVMSSWVIVKCCKAILIDKTEVTDSHGQAITFESQDLWAELSVMDATSAVSRFYGNDFHIINTANAVTNASGFGDNVEAASPLAL